MTTNQIATEETSHNIKHQVVAQQLQVQSERSRDQFHKVMTDLTKQTRILRRDKLLKLRPKTVSWAIEFREIHLKPWNQAQFLKVINRRIQL